MDGAHLDRQQPVSDYGEAQAWLWINSNVEDWLFSGPLPLEARLICDTYWITEKQLRRHLLQTWKEVRV